MPPNKWNRPHRSRFTHAAPPAPLPSSPPVPPPVGPPPPAPADALFDQFLNPPVEFRPWLRWDLNERLNPRKLGRQARDMHRLGFGGALCHEALGLAADPGGPPWREALDATREAVRDINFTLVVGERVSGRRPPVFMAGRPGASLAELRAGMDRLLARGETFIVPAAAAYSWRGDRKRQPGLNCNYQQAWWDEARFISAYLARMAFILESGKPDCGLLVLGEDAELADLIRGLGCPADMADDQRVEKMGAVKERQFTLGAATYHTVVMSGAAAPGAAVVERVRAFAQAGGSVWLVGEMNRDWQDIVGRPSVRLLARNDDALSCAIDQLPEPGQIIDQGGGVVAGVRIQRRIKEDRIFVFIVNDVATAGQAFTLRFHEKHEWHIELWDALAGERRLLRGRSAGREGRDLECDIQLEPAGSALLVLTPQSASVPHPYFTVTRARARWLARPWAIECRAENALRMDQVAYSLDDGQTFSEPETCAQVRLKLAARLALGAPVRLRYELESELDTVPGAAVVIENLTGGSLAINGQTVHTDKAGWHWDTGFGKKEIDGLLRRGRNTVDFTFPWQAQSEIEPIYIVGPFGVFFRDPAQIVIGPRPIQLASGSWVRQGFPFYAGAIVYKTDFGLPGRLVSGLRAAVRLIKPAGFLFKVRLNGQSAGILAARPWVCEITEWIRGGRNDLEIEVVGSSANLTAEIGPSGAGLLDTGLIGGVELLTY